VEEEVLQFLSPWKRMRIKYVTGSYHLQSSSAVTTGRYQCSELVYETGRLSKHTELIPGYGFTNDSRH
jgi:hypothetical protein